MRILDQSAGSVPFSEIKESHCFYYSGGKAYLRLAEEVTATNTNGDRCNAVRLWDARLGSFEPDTAVRRADLIVVPYDPAKHGS